MLSFRVVESVVMPTLTRMNLGFQTIPIQVVLIFKQMKVMNFNSFFFINRFRVEFLCRCGP